MTVAIDLLLAPLLAGFGVWRIMAGLSRLEMIDRHIPGADLFDRHVPRFMRASEEGRGVVDLLGGAFFLFVAVVAVIGAIDR